MPVTTQFKEEDTDKECDEVDEEAKDAMETLRATFRSGKTRSMEEKSSVESVRENVYRGERACVVH